MTLIFRQPGPGLHPAPAWFLAILLVLPLAAVAEEFAAPEKPEFDIPAQPLPVALDTFSLQSGYQVSASAADLADLNSRPVSGRLEVNEALDRMLSGTGLHWHFGSSNTVVVSALPPLESARMLPAVRVQAEGEDSVEATDQPYREPGSSARISQKEIERFRGMSVGDMFKGSTGVMVAENRNSGGLNINIRGMQGQGRVPVLVDGARQETTVYRGYAGATSRSYVDPDLIGSVEIDKGPTMGASGTGATGGLVSMVTLKADDIAKPGNTWGLRLRGSPVGNNSGSPPASGTQSGYATGGSLGSSPFYRIDCLPGLTLCDGEYSIDNAYPPEGSMDRPDSLDFKGYAGSLATTARLPGVDLVAAYARRSQGNYYAGEHGPTPVLDLSERYNRGFYTEVRPEVVGASRIRGGEQVVNTSFDSESLLLKSTLYPGNAHTLAFSYLRYDSEYGELMPSQLIWFGKTAQTELSRVTANTYTTRYQWQPADSEWFDLDVHLWHTDTDSLNNAYTEEMLELLSQTTSTENYRRWGADITNTTQVSALGDFQLRYGLAWQNERVQPKYAEVDALSLMRDGERSESSAFAAMKWTLLPALTLDAGVRYTRFDVEDNKPVVIMDPEDSPCADQDGDMVCDSRPEFSRNTQSGSAPVASLTWEPLGGLQLYLRYAEALRMPSLFESTSGFSVAPAPGIVLQPEHTRNREVGVNLLRRGLVGGGDVARAKLAYFNNRTEDYITRTIPNAWEDTSVGLSSYLFRTRNIDSVAFDGVELTLDYDAGWIFVKAAGTSYAGIETCHTGSYRRQRCTDYGIASSFVNNMIPPKWEANATLGFRPFSETLEFGAHANWVGERNRVPEFNDQTETSRSYSDPIPWHRYSVIDAFVTWQPNDTVTVDFNIDNITDEYYIDALSLGLVPAPGRTTRLSANLHF
ncbi:TonB-dependent receptor [Microbulbifer litoralis]|uniref:TonB-dependent receptor n=1 Tax=Microbulbifer litoralis TaxID=2933965 RepID=UPI002027D1F0|nr:TonB-dependent receptor [Microbulbifer sp. GX H0434]